MVVRAFVTLIALVALAGGTMATADHKMVAMPKVVGLPYEEAKRRLHARGLQVGVVVPGHCPRPVGVVCRQNPQSGRKVDITEPVNLIVSRGPKP